MNQLTQLFRFIIPGGIFVVYMAIFYPLSGSSRDTLLGHLKDHSAFVIFLAPVFGYLASTLHHIFYNILPFYRMNLQKYRTKGEKYSEFWSAFNINWRKNTGKLYYADFDARNTILTDLMHGNGTNLTASLLTAAILVTLRSVSISITFDSVQLTLAIMLGILILIHVISYCISRKHAENFVKLAVEELRASPKKP